MLHDPLGEVRVLVGEHLAEHRHGPLLELLGFMDPQVERLQREYVDVAVDHREGVSAHRPPPCSAGRAAVRRHALDNLTL